MQAEQIIEGAASLPLLEDFRMKLLRSLSKKLT